MDIEWLDRRVAALAARPNVLIALADGSGRILAGYPRTGVLREWSGFAALAHRRESAEAGQSLEALGPDGIQRIFGVAGLGGPGRSDLRVIVGLHREPVAAAASFHLYQNGAISAAVLLLGLGAVWIVSRLSRSMEREDLRLRTAVSNRELMLRESHHRVRNNMQLVLSSLRANADVPDVARRAIAARLQSVAMVYNALLVSEDGLVDLGAYLTDIVQRVGRLLSERHAIVIGHADPGICVSGDVARSVGLIVNEACTNAVKYAFPGNRIGTVEVSLHRRDALVELSIEDDGVGFDERELLLRTAAASRESGAGSQLIENLAQGIGAEWQRRGTPGTGVRCLLTFPLAQNA